MEAFKEWSHFIFNNAIYYYSVTIMFSYGLLALFSLREIKKYKQKDNLFDYQLLLSSPYLPSISVIAPAFNEGKVILNGLQSFLSLSYPKFEVILVNDGSTDDT
ncbi:MAG: glycosyltransferase, partial [Bacteroidetes bacterium]|nr:glycosyltransferase [Bacteroidota bacterium]MBU1761539.1 glycosyltransferase [Bacteroidota bacterium]